MDRRSSPRSPSGRSRPSSTPTRWKLAWPGLHVAGSSGKPLAAATFNLNLFSAADTVLLLAGVVTALVYGLSAARAGSALVKIVVQFRFTLLTVMAVLALAYVMNFSGQTVTLGLALTATGPLFARSRPSSGGSGRR